MNSGLNQVDGRRYAAAAPTEATQKELPSMVMQIESAMSDAEAAARRMFDRLAPVRMQVPTGDTQAGRAQAAGSSPIGDELAKQLNRLRTLTSAIEQFTDELAI